MATYQLSPIAGASAHRDWQVSSVKPTTIWVEAESPGRAREKAQFALLAATNMIPGQVMPCSPWMNVDIVTCVEDPTKQVPADFVITESGDKFSCKGL